MTTSEQTGEERIEALRASQRYLDERLREVTEALERGQPKGPSKKLPPWYPEALEEAAGLRAKLAANAVEIEAATGEDVRAERG